MTIRSNAEFRTVAAGVKNTLMIGEAAEAVHQPGSDEEPPSTDLLLSRLSKATDAATEFYWLCTHLGEAIRLTQEYVGSTTLPPIEGWSWYDALRIVDPDAAEAVRTRWNADRNAAERDHIAAAVAEHCANHHVGIGQPPCRPCRDSIAIIKTGRA